MIVVRLVKGETCGYYYQPVNGSSFAWLGRNTICGTYWFLPQEWEYLAKRAKLDGRKLTKRWYHVKRLTEEGF